MIPSFAQEILEDELSDMSENENGNLTWLLDYSTLISSLSERDSLMQTIDTILTTERGEYQIFSDDFGVEFNELVGMPVDYCIAIIPELVRDALLVDDRIIAVDNFDFEVDKGKIVVSFIVKTKYEQTIESEVTVNV